MSKFKKYKRTKVAEMRPVTENDIEQFKERGELRVGYYAVSISEPDLENGSPRIGDMIARNPNDHSDKWLVAQEYYENNFTPIDSN